MDYENRPRDAHAVHYQLSMFAKLNSLNMELSRGVSAFKICCGSSDNIESLILIYFIIYIAV